MDARRYECITQDQSEWARFYIDVYIQWDVFITPQSLIRLHLSKQASQIRPRRWKRLIGFWPNIHQLKKIRTDELCRIIGRPARIETTEDIPSHQAPKSRIGSLPHTRKLTHKSSLTIHCADRNIEDLMYNPRRLRVSNSRLDQNRQEPFSKASFQRLATTIPVSGWGFLIQRPKRSRRETSLMFPIHWTWISTASWCFPPQKTWAILWSR